MAAKESSGSKRLNIPNHPRYNKAFESSLRVYPVPSLSARQGSVDSNMTSSGSDLNFTLYNWKENGTPSSSHKGCSSTPAVNCPSLTCDASVIEADQSCLPLIKPSFGVKNKMKLNFSRAKTESTIATGRKNVPMLVLPDDSRRQEKIEDDLASAEITLLYCEYVQAAYLESKAKKTLAERDKNATESLYRMWAANQVLMAEEKSLKAELETIQYLDQMFQYCQRENAAIEPLVTVLENVINQYKEISDAVDTLRHKLYAPGVSVPTDESSEAEISELIKEVKGDLSVLLHHFGNNVDKFVNMADILATIEKVMKEINLVVRRCRKLLSKVDSLTITETSLKIGEMNLDE